jgi:hypothetical protein
MYYGHYLVGSAALGLPATLDKAAFFDALAPVTNGSGFFEALGAILAVGGDIALRWAVGALIVSMICAIPAYFVTYWALSRRRGVTASMTAQTSIAPASGSGEEKIKT